MNMFAVLVASADRRKDIFDTCFAHSERIWKDCKWPRYAGFTSPHPSQYGFNMLVAKPTGEWRTEVLQYIDALPGDIRYILLMVEDTLFIEPVDGDKLSDYASAAWRCGVKYLRLTPRRKSWPQRLAKFINIERPLTPFEPIMPSEPYYSSTEMTLWFRDYLRDLLRKPGDAWSFEWHVTDTLHCAIRQPFLKQHQIVQKGKWNRDAPYYLARAGLPPPPLGRPYQSWSSRIRGHWQNLNFALFGFTSVRIRQWLKFS